MFAFYLYNGAVATQILGYIPFSFPPWMQYNEQELSLIHIRTTPLRINRKDHLDLIHTPGYQSSLQHPDMYTDSMLSVRYKQDHRMI